MRVNCAGKLFGWVTLMLVVAGCGGSSRHPAERVVVSFYVGLQEQDMDRIMDAIEPADRNLSGIGMLGLLYAIDINLGFLGLDLASLTAMRFKNLTVDVVSATADLALVRASGNIRYLALGLEVPFCEMHEVRPNSDGGWYIDVNSPERLVRLARLAPRHQEQLVALTNSAAVDPLGGLISSMDDILAIFLDLCE